MLKKIFAIIVLILLPSFTLAADRIASPDKSLVATIEPFLETKEKTAENIVSIVENDGTVLAEMDFRSPDKEHGYVIDNIQWTADSQFLVFSTYSSGGHQPWHTPAFFFARSDNKIRPIDDLLGSVVDANFEISSTNILKVVVQDQTSKKEKVVSVNLSDLMVGNKK
jgi:Trk-type K+ transport system membrane component